MSFADFVDQWTQRPEIFQARRLCNRGNELLIDYIGFYESVTQDFEEICERIGVKAPLPRHNRSVHADYRDLYSDRLKRLVATRLAEDIEFLGYSFDGPTALRQQELQSQGKRAA